MDMGEVDAHFETLREDLLRIVNSQETTNQCLRATIERNTQAFTDDTDGLRKRLLAAEKDIAALEKDVNKRTEISWALYSHNKELVKRNKDLEDKYERAKKIITKDKAKLKSCSCKASTSQSRSSSPTVEHSDTGTDTAKRPSKSKVEKENAKVGSGDTDTEEPAMKRSKISSKVAGPTNITRSKKAVADEHEAEAD
ncbi:hypothetical protein SARC_11988 [Sphaeroforma arctica JP610]|uniref:Uncharacterized protein n=1 Tax=Sphaeroforma arctica JP610 TaxID=667725 RepID=A0A0L0FGA2_9EUKA|nr:hypothetical protein SARC_11988 [Sphaeroforma arctica JP610]KNC75486.1 hypothetical protein SARC_11988 [Sphaeroforma arctica JP610]|eukprot:XP_014149388.1 hypothetical protein SARC_11988 [Sphaeroforma arctica JP610]